MSKRAAAAPPQHLSARSKAFWRRLTGEYVITDAPGLELLRRACEASDRADSAREEIEGDGATFRTRFGEIRVHPAIAVERDARNALRQLLRELRVTAPPDDPRIGRLGRMS
jgi:P27 family predicted phage terminase small subunit